MGHNSKSELAGLLRLLAESYKSVENQVAVIFLAVSSLPDAILHLTVYIDELTTRNEEMRYLFSILYK